MDCEKLKYEQELKAILDEFESSVSLENLKKNQKLIDLMDDNLSLSLTDYLNQLNIRENFQKEKEKLVSSLAHSEKYIYDEISGLIKLRCKPRRRIIVFRDIPKTHQNKEEIVALFKLSEDKNYQKLISKIEFSNELFFVYFNDEETTIAVFKWIEHLKETVKNLPFNFSAFVKIENLKRDLTHSEINDQANLSKENSKIVSNPKDFVPRKLSANEEIKQGPVHPRKESYSKFDVHDPFSAPNNQQRPSAYFINKYDMINDGKKINNYQQYEKRSKAYSIHENYYQPHTFIPLNKNYKIEDNKRESKFKYSLNDISRIFINMNFMKKFELPEFVEEEKIPEIFNDKAKNSLSIFTAKKEHVEVRERAHTFYDKPRKSEKNDYLGYNHYKKSKKAEY